MSDPRQDPHWELVRAAAHQVVRTPPGLVSRVLRSVNGLRGRFGDEPIEIPQEGGTLRIGRRALVLLTRTHGADLAARIGGIHVSAVDFAEGALDVLVTLRYGVTGTTATAELRTRLRAVLTDVLGVDPPPVNVHIADVHPAP
ncbi:hypothetical protein [Amycolatopsis suaedae]|uniref:Asp23/Gls24 family envelope stress response protein n=1 Tax=Amycolatopsis suaedae TaxID=2510978 RepID=A0A4Q7J1S0_9PSEU|nr:hypothetical protein [Amycolatopsis suaedae]RZQ61351.1 hypothetical protein EWH70_23420 [Amycolatopsis suaedae]